jgi:hypothetical protein
MMLAAALLAGCDDGAGPAEPRLTGRWVVDSADSSPLPYFVSGTVGGSYYLGRGQLDFVGDVATDTLRFFSHNNLGEVVGDTVVRREIVDYTLRNDSIFIERLRTPVSYVDTGVVMADTLILRAQRIDPQASDVVLLRYVKQ